MKQILASLAFIITWAGMVSAQGICSRFRPVPDRCNLNAAPSEQAKCLLRPVKKFANLGAPLTELPVPLDTVVGQPTDNSFTLDQVKRFLAAKGISEADVGGSLSVKLTAAKYFVIHDTSDFF